VSDADAEATARRLGLTDALIRRLRARGRLERCALSDAEIDRRLYQAHLAFTARDGEAIALERPCSDQG
jgi:hypothetical protein